MAIIQGQFDSTTLMKILRALSDREIANESLHIFLRAGDYIAHRLLYGDTKKGITKPYWPREKTWKENVAVHNESAKEEIVKRLRPFFDSAAYKSPDSFGELLCALFEACCQYCQNNQADAIHAIIEKCLKEEEICEEEYNAIMNATSGSRKKLFNTMIGLANRASPKHKENTETSQKKAAPKNINQRIQKFIDLWSRAFGAFLNDSAECEEALKAVDAALGLLWEKRNDLCYALPEADADSFPVSRCVFGDEPGEEPLIYAQLLQRKNEIISNDLDFSEDDGFSKDKIELLINQALSGADRIIRIVNTHSLSEKVLSDGEAIAEKLRLNAHMDKIELYCKLAEEIFCASGEDLIASCLTPAVYELRNAAVLTTDKEIKSGIRTIRKAFFDPSRSLGKKLGADFMERAKEAVNWEKILASLNAPAKPAVHLPKQDADFSSVFTPVFSAVYDSAAGRYVQNEESLILTTFQLLASGHIPLLQLPQVADNMNFLKLLATPAFKQLCQKGLIALSAFTGKTIMNSPKDYILSCLSNDQFRFSATGWFNHENEAIRSSCRRGMERAIENGEQIRSVARYFPAEALDDMERLYDSYRRVNEAFLPSHIALYHQDPAIRTAARPWATYPQQTLPKLVGQRIDELFDDDRNYRMPGRSDLLLRLEGLHQDALKENCFTRSDYENLIDRRRGSEDRRTLDKFHNLINYCYNLSNGRRSCDSVFSVQDDDELRLHIDRPGEISRLSGGALAVRYICERHKSHSPDTGLTYRDLSELVFDIREQMKDEAIRAQSLAHQLEKETGLGYEQIAPGRVIVSDMTVAVSQGENINVSIEPKKDAVKEGIEMNG